MSSRVGSKVDRLLRAWGFGENVVQKFQEEEIDEEAFDCLDRRLIEILFKTVGAQAKFLKHYQAYLVDKQTSSSEVTELKSEVRVKTESEDPDDSSDPGLITGDSPGPSHQSYESNSVNVGNGRPSQEHSPEEEVLEDTPYHVPEMVMSPEGSPQYVQAAGSYGKRSYPFGVSYENDGSKRVAMGSDKDENEQDMDVDWSRFPACPFSAEWYESCIPKTWPDDLQIAIEKNRLTSTQRNEIIRRIVDRMLGEGLRGDAHYKAVADVAISRFPCLGSHLTGNLGLVNQLRACAKNKVYQAKRRAKKEAGLLVESKKTPPVKRTVKLSEVVENGKPINVVIDESTGDLVLDESEYDVSEALLVLSGDSPSKGNYYSRENTSECQSQSAESELTHHPRNGNLRSALRSSDSKRSRASPPTSRDCTPDSEMSKRTPRKRPPIPRLSKHILAYYATEELEKMDLLTYLKTVSVESRAAVDYYESEGMLTEKHRSWITKVVTNHLLHLNASPTQQEYRIIAKKICQLFPSEQIETYFSPPDDKHRNAWGKLPHKVRNIKYQLSKTSPAKSSQFSTASSLHTRPVVSQKRNPPSVKLKDFDENDPKIKAAVDELKHNQESWPEILHNWEVTLPLRFNYLRSEDCVISEYFKQWPVLSLPQARVLFEQDFSTLYPENENGLLLRWKSSKKLLIKLVNAEILKSDTKGWSLLQELNKLPDSLSDLTLLTLLSSLCSKRAVYAKGPKTRTNAADKQSISSAEALNTFFIHVTTPDDIDTQLDQQREKLSTLNETLQPVVVCVGPTLTNIVASYVQVDCERYQLNSPIEAVDFCFKAIHSLHLRYSSPSIGIWYFLQRYFYELRTELDPDIGRVTNLLSSLAGLKTKLEETDQGAQPVV